MHALLAGSYPWKAAIFIAGHSGELDMHAKERRKAEDALWADRFATEDWETLMQAWNAQPIFHGSAPAERKEQDYSRKHLSDILRFWSLSQQQPLLSQLKALAIPILWVVGSRDIRYMALAQKISLNNTLFQIAVIPEAGHRILWDAPDSLQQAVVHFKEKI